MTICDIETLGLGEWHHYTSAHTKTAAGTLVGRGRDWDLKIIGNRDSIRDALIKVHDIFVYFY